MKNLALLLIFQSFWFIAVLHHQLALWLFIPCALLCWRLIPTHHSNKWFVTSCLVIGFVAEYLALSQQWFWFSETTNSIPPVWLLMIWLLFAITLLPHFILLNKLWLLTILLFALLAPLNYLLAIKLQVIATDNIWQLYPKLALLWLLVSALMLLIARRLKLTEHKPVVLH